MLMKLRCMQVALVALLPLLGLVDDNRCCLLQLFHTRLSQCNMMPNAVPWISISEHCRLGTCCRRRDETGCITNTSNADDSLPVSHAPPQPPQLQPLLADDGNAAKPSDIG